MFSLDSVITAIGMANEIWVMVAAIVVAVATMMVFAGPVSAFVERHPSIKMLALSFLLLIGVLLIAEAWALISTAATFTSRWGSRSSSRC